MPIRKKWSEFTDEKVLEVAPDRAGVYELGNRLRNVVYIGSSASVRARLYEDYLHKNTEQARLIRGKVRYFRAEATGGVTRAQQRERALQNAYRRKKGRLPELNRRIG